MALDFWKDITSALVPFNHPIFQQHDYLFGTNIDARKKLKCPNSDNKLETRSKIETSFVQKRYNNLESNIDQNRISKSKLKITCCVCPCLNCKKCKFKKEVKDSSSEKHQLVHCSKVPKVEFKHTTKKRGSTLCLKIRKIEDTINFVQKLGLRPAWRNKCLFNSPSKKSGLKKTRQKLKIEKR